MSGVHTTPCGRDPRPAQLLRDADEDLLELVPLYLESPVCKPEVRTLMDEERFRPPTRTIARNERSGSGSEDPREPRRSTTADIEKLRAALLQLAEGLGALHAAGILLENPEGEAQTQASEQDAARLGVRNPARLAGCWLPGRWPR
jgi:hypothetical protein